MLLLNWLKFNSAFFVMEVEIEDPGHLTGVFAFNLYETEAIQSVSGFFYSFLSI